MNQEELLEALLHGAASAADSDATDNEPNRDTKIEAELLRDAFVNLSRQPDLQGHGRPRKGWLLASTQERQRIFRHTGIAR
jgi:hypothetical protein